MESNLVIKVKYGDSLRRFTANIGDDYELGLSMADLRAKIKGLFNFPADAELSLTYLDEDGDVVTLVDDDDLRDVMRQRLKFLRIDVQLKTDKSSKLNIGSSGSSTPIRSPSAQPPSAGFSNGAADILKSVPAPLVNTLNEVLSKLSVDVAPKAASASPVLGDIVECLSKMGQSFLTAASQSGPVGTSETYSTPSAPSDPNPLRSDGLREVLPTFSAVDAGCKSGKEANNENAARAVDGHAVVDLNVEPPVDANPTGCATITSDPSASKNSAHKDKKKIKDRNGQKKGKSVSFETSDPIIDAIRRCNNVNDTGRDLWNECPFSGMIGPNGSFVDFPNSQTNRSFVPTDGNNTNGTFHKGIQCDSCGILPITGPRFKSKLKDDYDLCSICFSKVGNGSDYIRLDRPVHYPLQRCFKPRNHIMPRFPPLGHPLRNRAPRSIQPKLDSQFVLDVNIADGTVLSPCMPFTKIWRMRNNGKFPWHQGLQLVWIGGDKISDALQVELEIPANGVPVDGELDVAADFITPPLAGQYVSYWRMASQSGQLFGQRVWVLIHVDNTSLNVASDNLQGLNLNLPPESTNPNDSQIVDLLPDFCAPNAGTGPVKPLVNEQLLNEFNNSLLVEPIVHDQPLKEVNNILQVGSDVRAPIPTSSSVSYPNVDLILTEQSLKELNSSLVTRSDVSAPVLASSSATNPIVDQVVPVPNLPSSVAYPKIDQGVYKPASPYNTYSPYPIIDISEAVPSMPPQAPAPAASARAPAPYPIIDISEAVPSMPSQAPAPAASARAPAPAASGRTSALAPAIYPGEPSQDSERNPVEQTLLKELHDMGFKQVDLNKEILRMNDYDLEKSVDDLCGVAEWDPMLEELQEMGFCDAELNKVLLKKNNGSIKKVVMDLLSDEKDK